MSRVARRELVSIQAELRLLLYGGVLVTMAGVGLLVRQNLDRIGPVAVASGLALASAVSLGWVTRRAAPFSWGEGASPHLAFDYILLLGVLLSAATLAYVEASFTPLGRAWPWHLLIVSLFTGAAAFRFDSRVVFSLALSTFAAWRGVSSSLLDPVFGRSADGVRANMLACGGLFIALGVSLQRSDLKPHFEPVAVHLGWLLVLGAFVSGSGLGGGEDLAYTLALLATGAGLATFAFRARRFPLFVLGVLAGYLGLSLLFLRSHPDATSTLFLFCVSSLGLLGGLLSAHRTMKVPEPE